MHSITIPTPLYCTVNAITVTLANTLKCTYNNTVCHIVFCWIKVRRSRAYGVCLQSLLSQHIEGTWGPIIPHCWQQGAGHGEEIQQVAWAMLGEYTHALILFLSFFFLSLSHSRHTYVHKHATHKNQGGWNSISVRYYLCQGPTKKTHQRPVPPATACLVCTDLISQYKSSR